MSKVRSTPSQSIPRNKETPEAEGGKETKQKPSSAE
ncbi:hypothetical protein Tco_0596132, partial [Tanacetum coccineum]